MDSGGRGTKQRVPVFGGKILITSNFGDQGPLHSNSFWPCSNIARRAVPCVSTEMIVVLCASPGYWDEGLLACVDTNYRKHEQTESKAWDER
jgi:hypothetical protein